MPDVPLVPKTRGYVFDRARLNMQVQARHQSLTAGIVDAGKGDQQL